MCIRVAKGMGEAAFSSVCDFESGSRNVHDDERFEEKIGGGERGKQGELLVQPALYIQPPDGCLNTERNSGVFRCQI